MGALKNISNIVKYTFYILALGIIFSVGFRVGRKSVKVPETPDPVEVIKYVESEPVHDTLWKPKPYAVEAPADTFDILKDCIAKGIYQELWPKDEPVDEQELPNAVLKDWATKRTYKDVLFDTDTLGKFTLNTEIQYNRVNSIDYEFIPVTKNVEQVVYSPKKWSPFVEVGMMYGIGNEFRDKMGEIGGGVFYNDKFGAELKYQRGFNSKNDYLGGSILLKF